eukprot:CFRG8416T1
MRTNSISLRRSFVLLIMESLLHRLAAQCGEQMQRYENCVSNHPKTWSEDCAKLENELSACTSKSDKEVIKVRTACEKTLNEYRKCVEKNNAEPDVCEMEMMGFVECADAYLFNSRLHK